MYVRSVLTAPRPASYHPLMAMQRALGSLDDIFGTAALASAMPVRLDVREDDKAFHVCADLPGLSEKEVEATFEDGVLTIRGEKKIERDDKGGNWHVAERASGSFVRQMSIAAAIDEAAITATFDKGVLTIMLPKQAQPEPAVRKIDIKSS